MRNALIAMMLLISLGVSASETKMNQYLVKMISEIDSMLVLAKKADREQAVNTRIKFNFTKYKNNKGGYSNGLEDDLLEMKKAIISHINKPTIAPKKIEQLEFDYVAGQR